MQGIMIAGKWRPSPGRLPLIYAQSSSGWANCDPSKPQISFSSTSFPAQKISNQIWREFSAGSARGGNLGSPGCRKSKARLVRFRTLGIEKLGISVMRWSLVDRISRSVICGLKFDSEQDGETAQNSAFALEEVGSQRGRVAGQVACWAVTVLYVGWLFVLPWAPGDPVWAITPATIQMLIDQSLNFFFVLPLASILANAESVMLSSGTGYEKYQTTEALFNFVIGWTLLFAPLLFTDKKRDRFGGSLETLWIIQMFLTNTVLAPYMAIRQNSSPAADNSTPLQRGLPVTINLESLSRAMTSGAYAVGVTGAMVGVLSLLWAFVGRPEAEFGGLAERWQYFLGYVGSERLAYAFVWDIALYAFFQPWLIGDNLDNVQLQKREMVRVLRFVPYIGLLAYVLGIQQEGSRKI